MTASGLEMPPVHKAFQDGVDLAADLTCQHVDDYLIRVKAFEPQQSLSSGAAAPRSR